VSQQNAQATPKGLPHQPHPDRSAAEQSLLLLNNWRSGSAATAIVMGGLLPFAIAWHATYLIAISASLLGALILALGCQLARARRLATLATFPDFAEMPDLASKRKRLQSARKRRALAAGLRRTVAPKQPPRRFDCCPALPDRVAAMRSELLQLADELEQAQDPDPVCVALIHELLTDGTSPLYNPNVPAADLNTVVTRARAGITAQASR
jgi:hypothetical protein